MKCPDCNKGHLYRRNGEPMILDEKPVDVRTRFCKKCGGLFKTHETVVASYRATKSTARK